MPLFILRSDKMLDVNKLKKRYFDIKIGELVLKVEPPKIKTLKKVLALTKSKDEEAIDDIADALKSILSKNSKGYQVPMEIIDELDFEQMLFIIEEFFKWVYEVRSTDPN